MGKKIIIIISLIFAVFSIAAQELSSRNHLLGASATISPGFQKGNPDMNLYIHGFLYYHPEPRVSINGEAYWYVGAQEQQTLMAENSTIVFGPNYHLTKDGPFDPYVGLMPALSLVSAVDRSGFHPVAGDLSLVPLISMNAGVRFHFLKWFNAFVNGRYMFGTLVENYPSSLSLNEFRLSFGLGFNFYSQEHYKTKKD